MPKPAAIGRGSLAILPRFLSVASRFEPESSTDPPIERLARPAAEVGLLPSRPPRALTLRASRRIVYIRGENEPFRHQLQC